MPLDGGPRGGKRYGAGRRPGGGGGGLPYESDGDARRLA